MFKIFKKYYSEPYKCQECGLEYKEKKWAEKCQDWCSKYKSCNLEIIKHAIKGRDKNLKENKIWARNKK